MMLNPIFSSFLTFRNAGGAVGSITSPSVVHHFHNGTLL